MQGRQNKISRARTVEIKEEALQLQASGRAGGLTIDEIQAELLRAFAGELAMGEARMYAEGWTIRTVCEGLRKLASEEGLNADGLQDGDVWRWLRGHVYPRDALSRLCRLFRCHQSMIGWPARGAEEAIDCTPETQTDSIRRHSEAGDVSEVLKYTAWITSTNTSDDMAVYLEAETIEAAREHPIQPPMVVLANVLRTHREVQAILQSGRQLGRQARELFRIDTGLLAHACLLLGDVNRDVLAAAYAAAAVLAANEAGANPAEAYCARAQIARWRHRYVDAADLAARGFACSPPTSLRTLLACQEANAAALAREPRRAREALQRAEAADVHEEFDSAWSCPPGRHALYRLSVALHSGDPQRALREAAEAEAAWMPDRPRPFGTWAHARLAAGIAQLKLASVDGAAEEIRPVLQLDSEYRVATVKEHVASIDRLLQHPRFRGAREATRLRDQIAAFTSGAVA
jgi:hypothetical protein